MGLHARITPDGSIRIDTASWITHRTGGDIPRLTSGLHQTRRDTERANGPRPPDIAHGLRGFWVGVTWTWYTNQFINLSAPDPVIVHAGTRLDADVWIVRAEGGEGGPLAVIGINDHDPLVYTDTTTDPWAWRDPGTVIISCPTGHHWTWHTGRELVTDTGKATTITAVFGTDLAAPFSPAPPCTTHHKGKFARSCTCEQTPWIRCPTCWRRCDVELPRP